MGDVLVLPHEHIFCRFRSSDRRQAVDFIRAQLTSLSDLGVTDIVDLTAYTNPLSYLDFLEGSRITVHTCVGFYLERYVRKEHRCLPVEGLVGVLERREKRLSRCLPPATIKVAAGSAGMSAFERRAFEAAAQFHLRTGLPIVSHSPRGFEDHQDYLLRKGVPADAIMLSHPEMSVMGAHSLPEDAVFKAMARCAERGSYLCLTSMTGISSKADAPRVRLLNRLVDAGHADRLTVSGDSSWRSHKGECSTRNASRGKDYSVIFEVHEKMRRAGISGEGFDLIVNKNPARFFRFRHVGHRANPR
jgi:predicted metal-dependent phosphotriesterase family hydrolase